MPTYHFDIKDGANASRTVVELKDLAEAKCEALKIAATVTGDSSGTFWDKPEWMLIAADQTGRTLFQLQVLGAEGPAAQNLSRTGFGEGTFDQTKKSNEADTGVDGC